ncbi:DUF2326 domain-containing protein [Sphingobacterium siyangense]|uniref:DUF2326 domain-containing protein n=1 Tax=Sphingobacterium siyangense TaxID=459529 RepID=UPI002FDA026F
MLQIKRLYTIPAHIDPIEFQDGLNLILGEKDESSDKRNGVGKSVCIEFINFALLKRKTDSRVSLIPKDIFPQETSICLDFTIGTDKYTIQRSIEDSETPTLIENDEKVVFVKIEDATKYLAEKLFAGNSNYPSFRVMLGPLIRDERSEFKSLINCYDTKQRIAENYTPHLYLLGINIELYDLIRQHFVALDAVSQDIARIKEHVQLVRQKGIDDARSDLNELDDEVHSIEASIDKLENLTGYEMVRDDIMRLEEQIDTKRRRKAILKQQLSKLKYVSQKVDIDPNEVSEFYDHLKAGLGRLLSKSLSEVIAFKEKIDEFQNKLIHERREALSNESNAIDKELSALDLLYTQNLEVINQKGELKNLKQTYAAYKEKADQLSQLRSFVDRFDQLEIEKQTVKTNKEADLLKLQSDIQNHKNEIDSFEKTILSIHEFIQGNKQASFKLKNTTKKQIIEIIMRIDSDGSHSVEREKVFIYDIALLLNENTRKRHPGFLIHDNIFDVDQDTLIKSIQFLDTKAQFDGTQYILTINSDRLEAEPELLNDLGLYIRAKFTKQNRFLKNKYQESRK